jgi:excisionase family DNA binding protein
MLDNRPLWELLVSNAVQAYEAPNSLPSQTSHINHANNLAFVPEPLLDSEEAAAIMKIHPKTLQKLARRGEVGGIRVGKLWRFRASDIRNWIATQ